ncbi:MAG TPA: hypothetical protein VF334_12725 [Polyangia bacterium]
MQTNASFVRISLVAIAGVLAVACAGPSSGPTQQPQQPGTSGGGSGGTGGGGSGGTTGTGGNGGTTGTGGGDTTPDGGTTTPAPDGGVTPTLGCAGYVACLKAAMSDADAMKCDSEAKSTATSMLDAVDTCVGSYCLGMSGTAARCKQSATDGSMQNLDGTAAFDMNGAPTGDCGACLVNGEAGLWGDTCMPATDPACNTTKCAQQTAACQADK